MKGIKPRLAAIMALILILTGCSTEQAAQIILYDPMASEENREVTMFGYKADTLSLTVIEDILHGFMDQTSGVTITYEGLSGDDYWDALTKRASADVLDDLFMVDHDRLLSLTEAGLLADLSSIESIADYGPLTESQLRSSDGAVYFLPISIAICGLFVNYDLLSSDGLEIPEDYGSFSAVCDFYVRKGVTPIVCGIGGLENIIAAKGLFPVYMSENTESELDAFNSDSDSLAQQLHAGVELVGDMLSAGWVSSSELLGCTLEEDIDLFLNGDRPFLIAESWVSPYLTDMDVSFSFGLHPLPIMEDGGVLVLNVDTGLSVSAGTANRDEVWDFLSYMLQPDVVSSYCRNQSGLSPMAEDQLPPDDAIKPCEQCLSSGRTVFGSDYRLRLPVDEALNVCAQALIGGTDVYQAESLLAEALCQQIGGSSR